MQRKSSGDKTPPLLKPTFSPSHFQKVRQLFETISSRPAESHTPDKSPQYGSQTLPLKGKRSDDFIFFDSSKTARSKMSVVALFEPESGSAKDSQPYKGGAPSRSGAVSRRLNAQKQDNPSNPTEPSKPEEAAPEKPEAEPVPSGAVKKPIDPQVPFKHRTIPLSTKSISYSSLRPTSTFYSKSELAPYLNVEPRSTSEPPSTRDSFVEESSFYNIKSEQDAVLALSLSLNGLCGLNDVRSEDNDLSSDNLGTSQTLFTKDPHEQSKDFDSVISGQTLSQQDQDYFKSPRDEAKGSQPRPQKKDPPNSSSSRRSCLVPKNLEPSLSAMLDTMDLEGSSSQSSTRNSLELSPFTSIMSSASTAHSGESEDSLDADNSTDDMEFKSPLESPALSSKSQPSYIYRKHENVNFSSPDSLSFIPMRRETSSAYEGIRAASEYGTPASGSVPFPPPKSSLRKKPSDNKVAASKPPAVTPRKPKSSARKLSDPGNFTNAATKPHPRPLLNGPDKMSFSHDALIPKRLESLDHLKSHSADALTAVQANKHKHVIQELVETEGDYLSDIRLIKKIYLDAARERAELFTARDLQLIFINIEEIIFFTAGFSQALQYNTIEGTPPLIGKVFVEKHAELQRVYSQYFKMHEVSNSHLQELYSSQPAVSQFLLECDAELKKYSKAWDLHSLLIKPIQRVLKYPLLIKELLSVTSPANPDHTDLTRASKLIQSTADYYNELKRRKDVIDRIIGPKSKKTELHIRAELNKKLFRGAIQLRKMAGLKTKTVDEEYNALAHQFHNQEGLLRRFWDEVQRWTLAVEDTYNLQERQSRAFLALYAPPLFAKAEPHNYHLFSAEFSKLTLNLSQEMVSFLNHEVYTVLYEKINHLIRLFNTPALLMKKRDRKLQDHDIISSKENKGSLVESAEAYQLINQELVRELPRFLDLSREMFSFLVARFSWIQQEVYRRPAQQLARLLLSFERPHDPNDNIVRLFNNRTLGEGALDPFVKAAHAIINSGVPADVAAARLARSVSSDRVAKSELVSPTNTINGPLEGIRIRGSRISQPLATISYSRPAPYPSLSPQLFVPEKDKDDDSDNDSVSALDGSFLVPNDQETRRDHLLVDVESSPLGLSLMSMFEDKPPKPPKKDVPEVAFNSLRSSRTQPVAKHINLLTHNKSSSSPENAIPKELIVTSPPDHGSIHSVYTSDMGCTSPAILSRQGSHTSSIGLTDEARKNQMQFTSSESLTSSATISSYQPSITPRGSHKSNGRQRHKPRPVLFECKAAFPYSAASETELSLIPGMDLRVFKCSSATSCPWWYGEDVATGIRGWFPSGFCKRI
ncbi:hypothetical protein DSO57_1014702 [Entomophthora muscae]|uniref:Uncharacterized protein n=1 Tax=Entomophthora muscae TaxID=34485 RepID=A0ACC2T5A2_9FUNG|nr:hypothetical protein DSO57_1014702 [Entomophthora muscae]